MAGLIRKWRFKTRTLLLAMLPIALICLWPGRVIVSHLTRHHAFRQIRSTGGMVEEGAGGYTLKLDRSQLLHLSALTDVAALDIAQASITDEGLSYLRPLRDLTFLDLSENPINDAGLASIEYCHGLTFLALQDTAITSAGLETLAEMTNLEILLLDGTQVDDDGLKHLHACDSLRVLSLFGTEVTARSIKDIVELPGLSQISLPEEWSDNSVAELMSERPDITVIQQRLTIPR